MKLSLEKTRAFWLYIVIGVISLALGIMLLPVWKNFEKLFFKDWGEFAINIMMSAALVAYILLYLVKRIRRYSGTPAQLVAIVELVLMVVIAVVCTVSTFTPVVSFGEPCQIFGLALWARGASGVFTGYYCDSTLVSEKIKKEKENKKNKSGEKKQQDEDFDTDEEPRGRVDDFTVWRLAFAVLLISAGTFMFITPPIKHIVFQWVFSCAVTFIGLFIAIYGASLKPIKVKVKEQKESEPSDVQIKEKENSTKKSFGSKKNDKPLLEEGKVTIKLKKDEETSEEKAEEKALKKPEEKPNEEKSEEEKSNEEKNDEDKSSEEKSEEEKNDTQEKEEVKKPDTSTALALIESKDTKKDKKKK